MKSISINSQKASAYGRSDAFHPRDGVNGKTRNPPQKPQPKIPMRIGTWNVRTLNREGLPELLADQLQLLNIDLLGINEMRHTGTGTFDASTRDGKQYRYFYSGHDQHHVAGVGFAIGPRLTNLTSYKIFVLYLHVLLPFP